jgi:hypothetical protein
MTAAARSAAPETLDILRMGWLSRFPLSRQAG